MTFPSWVYHRDGRSVIVEDPNQLKALGPGWEDTPAKFAEPKKVAKPKPEEAKAE